MYLKFFLPVILDSLMPCPVLGDVNYASSCIESDLWPSRRTFSTKIISNLEILIHRNLYDPKPLIFMIISKNSMLSVLALALIFSTNYLLLEHLLVLSIFMH